MPFPRMSPRDDADAPAILKMISDSVRERGYPPTMVEIAQHRGWSTPSSALRFVRQMEEKGLVKTTPGIARGIKITESGMKALTEEV